jgi:tetratricopeptide (TPR) repeat protein/Na+-translocating ferredoxin:NAD+ oxidoreductase RnfD subunit
MKRAWIWPSKSDARWFQLLFLAAFVVYAILSPGYQRTPAQFAAAVATCVLIDLVFQELVWKIRLVPVSGLITALGLTLLCETPGAGTVVLVGLLAGLSKHLLRIEGRHIFNPLNFGMTAALLYLPAEVSVQGGRWGGGAAGAALVAMLGLLTVYRANRLGLALTYIGGYIGFAALRSALTGAQFAALCGPVTGASFQLFAFFMATDPKTTPDRLRSQCAFGAGLGLLDNALRHVRLLYAPFFALICLTAAWPAIEKLFSRAAGRRLSLGPAAAAGSSFAICAALAFRLGGADSGAVERSRQLAGIEHFEGTGHKPEWRPMADFERDLRAGRAGSALGQIFAAEEKGKLPYRTGPVAAELARWGGPDLALRWTEARARRSGASCGEWLEAGGAALRFGQPARAAASLARAEGYCGDEEDLRRLISLYDAAGSPDGVRRAARRAVSLMPASLDWSLFLASAAKRAGRNEEAAEELARAGRLAKDDAQRLRVALANQDAGNSARAAAILDGLVARSPKSASLHAERGVCAYLMGRKAAALRDLKEALRLDPGLSEAYLSLGAIYERDGRWEQAARLYEDASRRGLASPRSPTGKALADALSNASQQSVRRTP